ncbi:hypothetical protein KR222_002638, partial [Zaprionus bogoriensis]
QKTSFVILSMCAYLALAVADVSHLPPNSYLPPPKPEQVEHMTIEQHELRELPEQVDYMHENEQGAMELAPSSQLTPPAMPEAEQMLSSRYLPPAQPEAEQLPVMPATRYLPPAAQQPAMPEAEQLPQMPATRYLPPAQPTQRAEPEAEPMAQPEMMPEQPEPIMEYMQPIEEQQPQEQPLPQAAPAMRYLPPAPQNEQPQYTYQQYQEQLQQQQQEQQMPYILDVQQPIAPSDVDGQTYEAEPAHELREDGYHYRQAAEEQRFRH